MLRRSLICRCKATVSQKAVQAATTASTQQTVVKKPPSKLLNIRNAIWEGLRHVYHGFRLFFINTRLAWRYSRQLKKGVALTRRERLLLESSTKDLLRLVPFSFFIVVPFAELLLPIALKMFPGLIPSTFESESQGRNRAFSDALGTLRARQRVMEFVSATALASFSKEQQEVIRKDVRGDTVTPKDIRLVAPYFARDAPFSIYKVPNHIAIGLGRIMHVHRWYHSLMPSPLAASVIRRRITKYYHAMREDDRLLRVEGLENLTNDELIKANMARGMRWTENEETLRVQLEWWGSIARDPSISYNTLFWVKPNRYSLRKSMHSLPVEQRRQLLGIQNLPESVRSSLETLCDTVDTVSRIEDEPDTADALAAKVEVLTHAAEKSDRDIAIQGIQVVIGNFLTEENLKNMFAKIRANKVADEPVTVSDVIERIGQDTHNSSHVVSTLFDAFDYGAGSKPITEATLLAIGARCREAARKPEKYPSLTESLKKAHGTNAPVKEATADEKEQKENK